MSRDESPNSATPSERRDAVREKAQQVQARQSRVRIIRAAVIATALVAVLALGAFAVTWTISSAASRPSLSPKNVTDDGFAVTSVEGAAIAGVPSGLAETDSPEPATEPEPTSSANAGDHAAVDIRVYVDYLSAGSRDFQQANAPQLSKWLGEHAATLAYHPVAMLTAKSNGTKYSLRAAGAAACVGTHSPDDFFAFNNTLLTRQPAVDSDGYSDRELADLAQASGVDSPKVVRSCIEEQSYVSWAKSATERALKGLPGTDDIALIGTPMVLVNGTPYVGALDDPKEFAQFVLTVASDTYYDEVPNVTPTPTPTP